jgi:hypothetical protein
MAKVKQTQIYPGITKLRSNAVKVYCDGAVAANDIISVTGVQGDFLKVAKADGDGAATLNEGLLYVADYAAASGNYTPVAIPWKFVESVDTSGSAIGAPVFLSDTPGSFSLTPGTMATKVGTVLSVHASTGQILLAPQAFAAADGIAYADSTSVIQGSAHNTDFEITQPAGTFLTDVGLVVTTAIAGSSGNINISSGTAAAGTEICGASALMSSDTAVNIGAVISVASGATGEGDAALTFTAEAPLYSATARTIHIRHAASAQVTAGVVRPYIKYQYA